MSRNKIPVLEDPGAAHRATHQAAHRRPDPARFFFQADDGIRDKLVTGVQTCALPISIVKSPGSIYDSARFAGITLREETQALLDSGATGEQLRSEERRVGKECRSRWSPDE